MERYVVLGQKDVLFHGIWKAQSKVSDSLIRTIATGLVSTPARVCKLVLTSAGLRLLMLDGKREQTDLVSFESLRDVLPNHYYRKCLLVIYGDASDKLSVMACTCDNARDVDFISNAYRNYKQQLHRFRIRSEPQQTKTYHEKPRFLSDGHHTPKEIVAQTRLTNGLVHETLTKTAVSRVRDSNGSSQKSELSCRSISSSTSDIVEVEDVFVESRPANGIQEPEVFIREPMIRSEKRVAFSFGVQTLPTDEDTDTDSVNSASSRRTLRDMNTLNDGIQDVKITTEKPLGISREQFYRRANIGDNQKTSTNKDIGNTGHSTNNSNDRKYHHLEELTGEDFDLRSVGIQTEQNSRSSRRYFKNNVKTATSNANKEKIEALRKRSSSSGPRGSNGPSSSGSVSEISSFVLGSSVPSFNSPGTGQGRNLSAQTSSSPATIKKALASGVTTVVKPIENVYQTRTAGRSDKGRGQRVIVFTSNGQSRM